jgi:Protein of unknown function
MSSPTVLISNDPPLAIIYIVLTSIGALASLLSHRSMAIFHDGLRPVAPSYLSGGMTRKVLASTSLSMSLGLLLGFGMPLSLSSGVILIHSILLATDIIGTHCPDTKWGRMLAPILGAAYTLLFLISLQWLLLADLSLPIDILSPLVKLRTPLLSAFIAFPALVVTYQHGVKKGFWTLALTLLIRQASLQSIVFSDTTFLSANGIAVWAGMLMMIGFALAQKPPVGSTASNAMLLTLFSQNIQRIRKNTIPLMIMGGLIACGSSLQIIASDPISLYLLAEGNTLEAALVAFSRAIGFIPLIATTAITTGIYPPVGLYFVFSIGLLIANPLLAFGAGAMWIFAEITLLERLAKMLDRFPGIKDCGDQIRTVMTKLLELSLLVGGMIAADAMASGVGYLFVASIYLMNKKLKKPLVEVAVGPIAVLLFWLILNLLALTGLYLR